MPTATFSGRGIIRQMLMTCWRFINLFKQNEYNQASVVSHSSQVYQQFNIQVTQTTPYHSLVVLQSNNLSTQTANQNVIVIISLIIRLIIYFTHHWYRYSSHLSAQLDLRFSMDQNSQVWFKICLYLTAVIELCAKRLFIERMLAELSTFTVFSVSTLFYTVFQKKHPLILLAISWGMVVRF